MAVKIYLENKNYVGQQTELNALQKTSHVNIVKMEDYFWHDNIFGIVMEYCAVIRG